jgi:hypothetical protein
MLYSSLMALIKRVLRSGEKQGDVMQCKTPMLAQSQRRMAR